MTYQLPDYRNCCLNLISSIAGYFGAGLSHPTLPFLDRILSQKPYRTIMVMLFDGLGVDLLEKALPETAFLRRHMDHTLSAVYPSTTTNATSSIECGQSPREHGWLGWTLFFPQIQKPVDIFTNLSHGEPAANYHVANRFIPREPVFSRISAAGQAEACWLSPFADPPVKTLDGLLETSLTLCKGPLRRYLYTYWPEPDHTMHEIGCDRAEIYQIVADIDRRIEAFADSLPDDVLLLLTADHGLIDGDFHYLEDSPSLLRMLVHPPTIEARAVSFHVKPAYHAAFPEAFRAVFADHFLLITGAEFIEQFLGDGEVRPAVNDFVGDYMALALDDWCIDTYRTDSCLKGVHAGLTPREMNVPLIVARK